MCFGRMSFWEVCSCFWPPHVFLSGYFMCFGCMLFWEDYAAGSHVAMLNRLIFDPYAVLSLSALYWLRKSFREVIIAGPSAQSADCCLFCCRELGCVCTAAKGSPAASSMKPYSVSLLPAQTVPPKTLRDYFPNLKIGRRK